MAVRLSHSPGEQQSSPILSQLLDLRAGPAPSVDPATRPCFAARR